MLYPNGENLKVSRAELVERRFSKNSRYLYLLYSKQLRIGNLNISNLQVNNHIDIKRFTKYVKRKFNDWGCTTYFSDSIRHIKKNLRLSNLVSDSFVPEIDFIFGFASVFQN